MFIYKYISRLYFHCKKSKYLKIIMKTILKYSTLNYSYIYTPSKKEC